MNIPIRTLLIVAMLALSATVASAGASPTVSDPFWMQDPLDPGRPAPDPATPPETAVPGYWWRDTTNQNAIAQHSEDQFTGQVSRVLSPNAFDFYVYHSAAGSNSTVIAYPVVSGDERFWLVGPGGGRSEADQAYFAFQDADDLFATRELEKIVLTGAGPEESWGALRWRRHFRFSPCQIYAGAGYAAAKAELDAARAAITAREDSAYGRVWLSWGPDGFLGAGSMGQYAPVVADDAAPDHLVSEGQTFVVHGNPLEEGGVGQLIELHPTPDGNIVVVPVNVYITGDAKALIAGDYGRYLPDAGSIRGAGASIAERIATLDYMIGLGAELFVPAHGMVIEGQANVQGALTAQRDALQSVYDQALIRINAGDTIDEAAAAVTLPVDLAVSPYNQELVSTVPGIVRNIYHDKLGWFGGETHELAATLTPAAKAAAVAEALGGADNLIAAARTVELNARDLVGAEKALYLAEAAYEAAPDSFTAKQVYAQALRKNAFMQKSAQIRNYYLSVAQALGTEQVVMDFAVAGDENADLAFSAAGFSGHFFGISGGSLETVRIVTLPPAEHGALVLAGAHVTAGQEITAVDLDGLAFTPTDNWNGQTGFTWNGAFGGTYAADDATVTITIAPLNDAPVLSTPLVDVAVDEDALSASIDLSPVFNDVDGDPLSYIVESSNPALVSATLDGATLALDFQAEQSGTATMTVSAADEAGEYGGVWATDDFVVTVNPVNDLPWATGQAELVTAGLARTFTLDYGDLETAQADLAVSFSGPSVGTLDTSALPSVTYLAPADYIGPDSFTYTITDRGDPDGCSAAPCAGALQAQATVTLDVAENAIKGRVYNDANANGSQDEGETGVAGVTVRLASLDGRPVVEMVTEEDGAYAFGALEPGAYQVTEVVPAGYVQTTADPAQIDLAPGQAVGGVDFGVVYSADLGVTMTADVNDKTIIYTFVVTNHGPAETLEAALINLRPRGVSYTTIVTTQGACQGGNTVTCQFGTLPAGSSVTVTIQANRTDKNNPIENAVTVSASTFDINLINNSATATVQ